jgi:hypothetical protein
MDDLDDDDPKVKPAPEQQKSKISANMFRSSSLEMLNTTGAEALPGATVNNALINAQGSVGIY